MIYFMNNKNNFERESFDSLFFYEKSHICNKKTH